MKSASSYDFARGGEREEEIIVMTNTEKSSLKIIRSGIFLPSSTPKKLHNPRAANWILKSSGGSCTFQLE
jgi:hypothetical protein